LLGRHVVKGGRARDVLKLVVSLVACQCAGLVGSIFTTPAIPTWYAALEKPFFTPPNWLSAAAGSLLLPYILWVSFAAVLNISLWILNP
jgi:benzodiazapine receptor